MLKNEFPEAVKRCGGDARLLIGTAAIVGEDAPAELRLLEEALERGDKDQSKVIAHTLRGMLSTFAERGGVVSGLQSVELAANQEDMTIAQQRLSGVKTEIEQLILKINAFVKTNPIA